MDGRIDGVVDGGPCRVGVESTIIDLTCTPPRLLRPGGLPLEELRAVLGEVAVDKAVTQQMAAGEKPRAPGMKYRHYAPKAPVTVITGSPRASARRLLAALGARDGVICFDEFAPLFAGHIVHRLGASGDKLAQSQHVFDALRTFDATDVPAIWAQCPDSAGLGLAVGNRLKKGRRLPHRGGGRRLCPRHHRRHRRGQDDAAARTGKARRAGARLRRGVSRNAPDRRAAARRPDRCVW